MPARKPVRRLETHYTQFCKPIVIKIAVAARLCLRIVRQDEPVTRGKELPHRHSPNVSPSRFSDADERGFVEAFVEKYHFQSDCGDYTPSDSERGMLTDFAYGMLDAIEEHFGGRDEYCATDFGGRTP